MITEKTHTYSKDYGQGRRKSGTWVVEQGADGAWSEEGAGSPWCEERAQETRREQNGSIFDYSMPVSFFVFFF